MAPCLLQKFLRSSKLLLLLLFWTVIKSCDCDLVGRNKATVLGVVKVTQGLSVDIRSSFSLSQNVSVCEVVHIMADSNLCGELLPSSFSCEYTGGVRFHHYGCRSTYETINFHLLSSNNDTDRKIVDVFTIPIRVDIIDSSSTRPKVVVDDDGTLSVRFPVTLNSICSYAVTTEASIRLPHGRLTGGFTNRPIPCGLTPRERFNYTKPRINTITDYLLIKLDCNNGSSTHFIEPICASPTNLTSSPDIILPEVHLSVYQCSKIPIDPTLLPLGTIQAPLSELKFVFPVLNIGGLYPITAAPNTAMIATTFTFSQLSHKEVIYTPDAQSVGHFMPASRTFYYQVTDIVGSKLAEGSLHVKLYPRTAERASLRKSGSLSVQQGQSVAFTHSYINFYNLAACHNPILKLLQGPSFGSILYKGLPEYNTTHNITILKTTSLQYNSLTKTQIDYTIWGLQCSGQTVVRIPSVINVFQSDTLSCHAPLHSHTLYALQNFSVPLSLHIPHEVISKQYHIRAVSKSGMLLNLHNSSCTTHNNTSSVLYPYTPVGYFNVASCGGKTVTNSHLSQVRYIPPVNGYTNTDSITLLMYPASNKSCTTKIKFEIIVHSLREIFIQQKNQSNIFQETVTTIPTLVRNTPLILSNHDSLVLTESYLFVNPVGQLQNQIHYQVIRPPQNGHLCSMNSYHCTRSVPAFTQADIIGQHIYYKPFDFTSTPVNDLFEFTFWSPANENVSEPYSFIFRQQSASAIAFKQFWVPYNRHKSLAPKFIYHLINQLKGKDINFTVLVGPSLGKLKTPLQNNNMFTLSDLTNRTVIYNHTGLRLCSDSFLLEASDGLNTVTGSISVAIRAPKGLHEEIVKETRLIENGESFTLNETDLPITNSFCDEFISFKVTQLPEFGSIRVRDKSTRTVRQLDLGGVFSVLEVKRGLVTYSLSPLISITQNTTDTFLLEEQRPDLSNKKKIINPRSVSNSIKFVIITMKEDIGSGIEGPIVNLTVNSPKQLSNLPKNKYGTIFDLNDFYEWNKEFDPIQIIIIITEHPHHGDLKRKNIKIGEFSLQDIYDGHISYENTLPHHDYSITEDSFVFSVLIENDGKINPGLVRQTYTLQWCYFYTEDSRQLIYVEETTERVRLTVRRTGSNLSFPGYVNITTEQENATGKFDCQNTDSSGDYCHVNRELVFKPGQSKLAQYVTIYNDEIAEGMELFKVRLLQPQGCLVPRVPPQYVWITDYEDYSRVGFKPPVLTSRRKREECMLEVTIKETIGVLKLNMTRTGSLSQKVGVICYTNTSHQSDSSRDITTRPNNISSMVYFEPGKRTAQCQIEIVNDKLNEPTESIYVFLGQTDGLATVDYSTTPLCIFILHDEEDVPVIRFNSTSIFVKEGNVKANYTLVRTGADLSSESTVYISSYYHRTNNATRGFDYDLSPNTAITFRKGETSKTKSIQILADNLREGTEVFHIHIASSHNGLRGSPDKLKVVILDSFEDTVIGFTSLNYTVNETQGIIEIPFKRSGFLNVTSNLTCMVSRGTATNEDYIALHHGEKVTVFPYITDGNCHVALINDGIHEGQEHFTVTMSSVDSAHRLISNVATVVINDPEDVPLVSFTKDLIYIEQPLSNYPLDQEQVTLTISRSADLEVPVHVLFTTRESTALQDIDYTAVNSTLFFSSGLSKMNITVPILANHHNHHNVEFFGELSVNQSSVRLSTHLVKVVIKHKEIQGVYFPTLPRIASVNNKNLEFGTKLYHDHPLVCITSCDPSFPISSNFSDNCIQQQINFEGTKFVWEFSTDGEHFTKLEQNTLFTDTRSKMLYPVYLSEGLFVRCSATAVDDFGVEGYSRMSEQIYLAAGNSSTQLLRPQSATLQRVLDTSGANENLLLLHITVPHIPNSIPLVSSLMTHDDITTLLTFPPSRRKHTCSNFGPSTIEPLLMNKMPTSQFYSHFNLAENKWIFKVWLPMQVLVDECGAVTSNDSLAVMMHTTYFHMNISRAVAVDTLQLQAVLNLTHSPPRTTVVAPFNYHPLSTELQHITLNIKTADWDSQSNTLVVILYTDNELFKNGKVSFSYDVAGQANIHLLYTDRLRRKQEWMLVIEAKDSQLVHYFNMWLNFLPSDQATSQYCDGRPQYTFNIPLTVNDSTSHKMQPRVEMNANFSVTISNGSLTSFLPVSQTLKVNHTVAAIGAWACSSADDLTGTQNKGCLGTGIGTLINILSTVPSKRSVQSGAQENNDAHLSLALPNDLLHPKSGQQWYIHVVFEVSDSNHKLLTNEVILPFSATPIIPPNNTPLTSNPTTITDGLQPTPAYVIAILATALFLFVMVCIATVGLLLYSSRQRWLLQKRKLSCTQDDEESCPIKTVKATPDNQETGNTHSRKARRGRNSVQLLIQKAAEITQKGMALSATRIEKPAIRRTQSLPDLTSLAHPISNKFTATAIKPQTASVKPITRLESLQVMTSASSVLNSEALDTALRKWKKSHNHLPPSTNHIGHNNTIGWYERIKARQTALENYAKAYETKPVDSGIILHNSSHKQGGTNFTNI